MAEVCTCLGFLGGTTMVEVCTCLGFLGGTTMVEVCTCPLVPDWEAELAENAGYTRLHTQANTHTHKLTQSYSSPHSFGTQFHFLRVQHFW